MQGTRRRKGRALPLNQIKRDRERGRGPCKRQTAMTTTARRGYVLTADFHDFRARSTRR